MKNKLATMVVILIMLGVGWTAVDFNKIGSGPEEVSISTLGADIGHYETEQDLLLESFVNSTCLRSEAAYICTDEGNISGILLYDGSNINTTSNGELVIESSFLMTEGDVASKDVLGMEIIPYIETPGVRHVYTDVLDASQQAVVNDSYVRYGAVDGKWYVEETSLIPDRETILKAVCDRAQDLFDYDHGKYLNHVWADEELTPVSFERTDWNKVMEMVEEIIKSQANASMREYLQSNVYFAMEALDTLICNLTTTETFMGFSCDEIRAAREAVDDSQYVWITLNGLQALDAPQTPSAWARIMTAVVSVIAIGASVALAIFAPPLLPLSGAIIGAAVEATLTVSIMGQNLDPIDLAIGAVSGSIGAVLGVWSSALVDSAFSGLRTAIFGGSLSDIAFSMGVGFASGVVIGGLAHGLTKAVKHISAEKKIQAKVLKNRDGSTESLTPADKESAGVEAMLKKEHVRKTQMSAFDREHPPILDEYFDRGYVTTEFVEVGSGAPYYILRPTGAIKLGEDFAEHVTYYVKTGDRHVHIRNSTFEGGKIDKADIIYSGNDVKCTDTIGFEGTFEIDGVLKDVYYRVKTVNGVIDDEFMKRPYFYQVPKYRSDGSLDHNNWKSLTQNQVKELCMSKVTEATHHGAASA